MKAQKKTNLSVSENQEHRETVILGDLKKQLRVRPVADLEAFCSVPLSDHAVDCFLVRFLRAKHLSTAEAIAKLKRRRAFEATLPTLRVTPAVVAVLRSGAISLLGLDYGRRPVLFLDLSVGSLPVLEVDEAQRLLILILEYMQARCIMNSCVERDEKNASTTGAPPPGTAVRTDTYAQQFVLLINEYGTQWTGHSPIMRKASAVYSIFSKYYPSLLDLVLVCDASFEVRQGIKAALLGSPQSFSQSIQLVQRSDLVRFIPESIIPHSVGGATLQNTEAAVSTMAESGTELADAVLRHWYTLTSFIQLENESMVSMSATSSCGSPVGGREPGPAPRPLYLPPPLLLSSQNLVSMQNRLTLGRGIAQDILSPRGNIFSDGGLLRSRSRSWNRSAVRSASAASSTRGDGICSAILSDEDEFVLVEAVTGVSFASTANDSIPRQPAPNGRDPAAARIGDAITPAERAQFDADPTYVLDVLRTERMRRLAAEQRLRILELGISIDSAQVADVEACLASIHQDINVLVADIVVKARAAYQRGQAAPSVSQLLDRTLLSLEMASGVPEFVPAMSLAKPTQRETDLSVCCTMM